MHGHGSSEGAKLYTRASNKRYEKLLKQVSQRPRFRPGSFIEKQPPPPHTTSPLNVVEYHATHLRVNPSRLRLTPQPLVLPHAERLASLLALCLVVRHPMPDNLRDHWVLIGERNASRVHPGLGFRV